MAMKKHDINALVQLYNTADETDREIFAEQRSNVLLVSGEHYAKRYSHFHQRLRSSKELTEQQKLRLTKNHVQNICKIYVNHLLTTSPNVGFKPKNPSELQDQKAAELHRAVWMDAYHRLEMEERIHNWAEEFFSIGEVVTKVFYDPTAGKILGWEPKIDEMGRPELDEEGQPVRGTPVYEGSFVFEEVFGFNLLRAPEARSIDDSPYLIIRKMVDKDHLIAKYGIEGDKKGKIQESANETYVVFDATKGDYVRAKNQVLVFETYFRPCEQYPQGYFYISTKTVILVEGELPGGIFPIVYQGCDRRPTVPRATSIVKTMRPYQAEINRAASKMAEHQITLGDDKLIVQNGSKVSAGMALPGVRSINVTGMEPKIIPGRDGSQYLQYMLANIQELYKVMGVMDYMEDKEPGQMDPYTLLFRSAREKKRFQIYIRKFERYLIKVVQTYLKLAKIHMPEEQIVYAVGRNEIVNIAEFKNTNDLCYEITIEPQSADVETKLGQQLSLNHLLQYVGTNLSKEDIGKIVKAMPYANVDDALDDLTLDADAAKNDILALDRGQMPPINEYDNHPYMIKRLTNRMRMPDFQFLDPVIQRNYALKLQAHQEAEALRLQQIKAMEAEFIPVGGYLVACDFYVQTDPQNPEKTRRARIPSQALEWLMKRLETQGASQEQLEQMNAGAVAQIAEQMQQLGGQEVPQEPMSPPVQ